MNTQIALAGTIFVTFLWGSWFQTVKHTGNFPVHAFISMMYAVSVVIVWGAIGFLGAEMVPHGVLNEMTGNRPLALLVFACGLVFGVAMQLQLTVVKRIGLILSTSVSATCSILGGTAVSMMFAGCPPIPWRLLWACALHYGRKVLPPLPVWGFWLWERALVLLALPSSHGKRKRTGGRGKKFLWPGFFSWQCLQPSAISGEMCCMRFLRL